MKTIIPILSICILMFSCSTSQKLIQKDVPIGNIIDNEWVSFDINTKYYIGKKLLGEYPISTIIIHKISDSTKQLAVLEREKATNTSTLITDDKVMVIDDNYQYIATYTTNDTMFYTEIVASTLQNLLYFFPMYFPHKYGSQITYSDSTFGFRITKDNDTIYNIPSKIIQKRCYTDGTCELFSVPLELGYSSKYRAFTEAKEVKKYLMLKIITESNISNIKFENKKSLLDSMFNITEERYKEYYRVPSYDFLPNRKGTSNLEVTDSVLDYPIVDVFTGNSATLRGMNGTILLCFINFGLPLSEIERISNSAKGQVDNCIWLIPNCTNIERIQTFAKENNLTNVYYAKDFDSYFGGTNNLFLFNENHDLVSSSQYIFGNLKRWIKKNLK